MAKRESSEKLRRGVGQPRNRQYSRRGLWYNSHMEAEMSEQNLPPHLANDLEAWKKDVEGPKASMKTKELV